MKIAICFSGQNRTGHLTSPNILRYIGDLLPECDVFTHFWDSETKGTGYANRLGAVSTDAEYHTAELTDADKKKIKQGKFQIFCYTSLQKESKTLLKKKKP